MGGFSTYPASIPVFSSFLFSSESKEGIWYLKSINILLVLTKLRILGYYSSNHPFIELLPTWLGMGDREG